MNVRAHFPYSEDASALHSAISAAQSLCDAAKERWRSENYIRDRDPTLHDRIGRSLDLTSNGLNGLESDLRDNISAAAATLWRLPLDPADSETLHAAIQALHSALLAVEAIALKLDYPISDLQSCLIPRDLIRDELESISTHVAGLDDGLNSLASARENTRPTQIEDALVQFAHASIGERSGSAKILAAEAQIDVSGMTNVLASAAKQAKDFRATIECPATRLDASVHSASQVMEREASRATAASLRVLKNRARRANDYLEAARHSATIWLDHASADAVATREIAESLQKTGFKLVVPATSEVDLFDFLAGRETRGDGPRALTADEKKLWALVAKTVESAKPRPLHFAVCLLTGAEGKDLAYAEGLCAAWPQQVIVASGLTPADTRRLRERHRNVISFRSNENEHDHALAALTDLITLALDGLTRA